MIYAETDNEIGINKVMQGDCLDVMRQMPDNFVDTIITDPPYSLNFMNKEWDNEIAFNPEVWREALRVAKPGAMLLAFGGTRTYHRLTCAIEDAGWEIRDCISYFSDGTQQERAFMASLDEEQLAAYLELHHGGQNLHWVYGQGMGLGLNVSKAIDKAAGEERKVVGYKPSAYPDSDCWGIPNSNSSNRGFNRGNGDIYGNPSPDYDSGYGKGKEITAPSTPLAKTFDGYGTALKPVVEPIVVAMKPLDGTYAENAERWGVAGLNIDGGRVGINDNVNLAAKQKNFNRMGYNGASRTDGINTYNSTGRFPSNLIHSNEPGVLREFGKAGVRTSGALKLGGRPRTKSNSLNNFPGEKTWEGEVNKGSAARYFATCPPDAEPARFTYCPKASSKERGNGNSHPTVKPLSLLRYLCRLTRTPYGGIVLDPFGGSGTTAIAAIAEKRDFILIEKEPDYVEMCKWRIAEYTGETITPKEIKVKDETVKQMALW